MSLWIFPCRFWASPLRKRLERGSGPCNNTRKVLDKREKKALQGVSNTDSSLNLLGITMKSLGQEGDRAVSPHM